MRLQEFFLWRDRKRKVYGFKNYGEEFCQKVFKRLSESYHPAKIERLFKGLLDTLKISLSKGPSELLIWIDDHFNQRSNELALQIEILDQQVSESVDEFRKGIKQPQTDILLVIDTISTGLDRIKQHAYELTKGFQITYDIDDILQEMLKDLINYELLDNISMVLKYNQDVRHHLDQVSLRIDKIKPRIREFIFEFNQRDFDRKTDKFIHYLLDNTKYQRLENQSRRLAFPEGITAIKIKNSESVPRFYIIPVKDFATKTPLTPHFRSIDTEKTKLMIARSKKRLEIKESVIQWVKKAIIEIEQTGKLDFSPFFFHILFQENNDLTIAIKTAQRLIKQCSNPQIYHVIVEENEYYDPHYLNLSLWKMTILKKM